eukprot:m.202464 g.202464  ORF g.202464 m.202464 type:complete len:56 (-) comp18831_c0_seq1:731-898(-)
MQSAPHEHAMNCHDLVAACLHFWIGNLHLRSSTQQYLDLDRPQLFYMKIQIDRCL